MRRDASVPTARYLHHSVGTVPLGPVTKWRTGQYPPVVLPLVEAQGSTSGIELTWLHQKPTSSSRVQRSIHNTVGTGYVTMLGEMIIAVMIGHCNLHHHSVVSPIWLRAQSNREPHHV